MNERYYWFQDMTLDPPTFPATRNNKLVWDSIRSVDTQKLESYMKRVARSQLNQRSSKRPRLDDIDIHDNIMQSKESVTSLSKKSVNSIKARAIISY